MKATIVFWIILDAGLITNLLGNLNTSYQNINIFVGVIVAIISIGGAFRVHDEIEERTLKVTSLSRVRYVITVILYSANVSNHVIEGEWVRVVLWMFSGLCYVGAWQWMFEYAKKVDAGEITVVEKTDESKV